MKIERNFIYLLLSCHDFFAVMIIGLLLVYDRLVKNDRYGTFGVDNV